MFKTMFATSMLVAASAALAEPVTFAIDPSHTVITFEALHMSTSTHRGRFQAKDGTVVLDRAAHTGKADITIDMTSLNVAVAAMNAVMRGERLFNVAQNPDSRFVGESFTFDGDKVASVSGTLTIAGKSQPATLKAVRFNCYENSQLKREVCGGDFETTIQRSRYGLSFGSAVVADDVKVLIQVEAIRQ